MRKRIAWINMLELGAENVPKQTKSKVEEHNVASEFRSDAQFLRKSLCEHWYTSSFFVTTLNHYIEFQNRFSAKAEFSGINISMYQHFWTKVNKVWEFCQSKCVKHCIKTGVKSGASTKSTTSTTKSIAKIFYVL